MKSLLTIKDWKDIRNKIGESKAVKDGNGSIRYSSYKKDDDLWISLRYVRVKEDIRKDKMVYFAFLLKKDGDGWKIEEKATHSLKWKITDVVNKWICEKKGVKHYPSKSGKIITEEQRDILRKKTVEKFGHKWASIEIQCPICDHVFKRKGITEELLECPHCHSSFVMGQYHIVVGD